MRAWASQVILFTAGKQWERVGSARGLCGHPGQRYGRLGQARRREWSKIWAMKIY